MPSQKETMYFLKPGQAGGAPTPIYSPREVIFLSQPSLFPRVKPFHFLLPLFPKKSGFSLP